MQILSGIGMRIRFKCLGVNKQPLSSWKSLLGNVSGTQSSRSFSLGIAKQSETTQSFDTVCTSLLVENINQDTQSWMCKRIENADSRKLSHVDKITVLNRLMLVHCFELFLLKEGPLLKAESSFCDCEIALPAVCTIIDAALKYDVESFVIGFSQLKMLNVLSKLLSVSIDKLFLSIVDCRSLLSGTDIAPYYMNSNYNNNFNVSLLGAASISQTICPLTLGITKALQDVDNAKSSDKVWSILCYSANDIADRTTFTNIVQLTTESKYSNNGSVHLIINEAEEDASPKIESQCKFVKIFADFIKAPIVHVKAEDVDSVINVMQLAADFKATYKRNIVVDLISGVNHNYPTIKMLTLPGLVKQLMTADKPPLAASYLADLVQNKVIAEVNYNTKRTETLNGLQTKYSKQHIFNDDSLSNCIESSSENKSQALKDPLTSYSTAVLKKIASVLCEKPSSFDLIAESKKLLDDRKKQFEEDKLNWSFCELLAYGSLLHEGIDVRYCCSRKSKVPTLNAVSRGSGLEKNLLAGLSPYMGNYTTTPSFVPLYASAGFEAGYSSVMSNALNIWSAPEDIQPKNLLKIIHDYLSCAVKELKTKITFIIPSYTFAKEKNKEVYYSTQTKQIKNVIETITDNDTHLNISCEVVNLSVPWNLYHILKKQAKTSRQKPLLIFVPFKYYNCSTQYSSINDLSGDTSFKPFIEEDFNNLGTVKNLVLCTGTVFHHLKQEKIKRNLDESVAIGRIEQLYPFPMADIINYIEKLQVKNIWWAQDEQYEDGWWNYVESKLSSKEIKVNFAGRSHAMLSTYKCPNICKANLAHIFETIENMELSSVKL